MNLKFSISSVLFGMLLVLIPLLLSTPALSASDIVQLDDTPFFVPNHVGEGDQDFHGHGPTVNSSVRIYVENHRIFARVTMYAKETKKDYTEANGSADYQVYSGPVKVESLAPGQDDYSSQKYTDSNHKNDVFHLTEKELVRSFTFVGDTNGNESGIRTGVSISFNPVKVLTEE